MEKQSYYNSYKMQGSLQSGVEEKDKNQELLNNSSINGASNFELKKKICLNFENFIENLSLIKEEKINELEKKLNSISDKIEEVEKNYLEYLKKKLDEKDNRINKLLEEKEKINSEKAELEILKGGKDRKIEELNKKLSAKEEELLRVKEEKEKELEILEEKISTSKNDLEEKLEDVKKINDEYRNYLARYETIVEVLKDSYFDSLRKKLEIEDSEIASYFTVCKLMYKAVIISEIKDYYTEKKERINSKDEELFEIINCYYEENEKEEVLFYYPKAHEIFDKNKMYDSDNASKTAFRSIEYLIAPGIQKGDKITIRAIVKGKM